MCLRGYPPMLVSILCSNPLVSQPIATCIEKTNSLKGLDFADYLDGKSSLQVDRLYFWELVIGSVCRSEYGTMVIHTRLGWVLCPTLATSSSQCLTNLVTTNVLRVDTQHEGTVGTALILLGFGVAWRTRHYNDLAATLPLVKAVTRWLSWKEFHDTFPDHYQLSLHCLLHRLQQKPAIVSRNSWRGASQKLKPAPDKVHYLPHHAVVCTDKTTTKLRLVFDASARSNGPSLNDCLHKSPKFDQLILDLLLRFRSYKIALTADIEKAFLMISVDNHHCDVLIFLWIDDVTKLTPRYKY